MNATDNGFLEGLTGNQHWEAEIFSSSSYFSNKYFDRYCAMAAWFSSFPPDELRGIYWTHNLYLCW